MIRRHVGGRAMEGDVKSTHVTRGVGVNDE